MELYFREIGSDYLPNEMCLKQLCRTVRRTLLEKYQNIIQFYTIIAVLWIRRFKIKKKDKNADGRNIFRLD
jgi:hypothetical protein